MLTILLLIYFKNEYLEIQDLGYFHIIIYFRIITCHPSLCVISLSIRNVPNSVLLQIPIAFILIHLF